MTSVPVADLVGKRLTLTGLSGKGKNVVRRDGAAWTIERVEDRVLFSHDMGPWLLIGCGREQASRWIHALRDLDFKYVLQADVPAVHEAA